ncbi:MAG: heme exporter protein CcmB [Deinococcota bacterium]
MDISSTQHPSNQPRKLEDTIYRDLNHVMRVAAKDIRLEVRSKAITIATLFFAILVLVILAFAIGPSEQFLRNGAAGALWVALAFAGVTAASQSYQHELEDSAFEQLLLYPAPRTTLFLGKLIANWCFMIVLALVLTPLCSALFGMQVSTKLAWLALTILLGTLGFALIGTFYAALTANLRARESLLPVLMLPIVVPVLLAAVSATGEIVQLGNLGLAQDWLRLLAGFDLIYLVVCSSLYTVVVEE